VSGSDLLTVGSAAYNVVGYCGTCNACSNHVMENKEIENINIIR
jgi:hypothetical protein